MPVLMFLVWFGLLMAFVVITWETGVQWEGDMYESPGRFHPDWSVGPRRVPIPTSRDEQMTKVIQFPGVQE